MTFREKKFILVSRAMMKTVLVFYLYAIVFSIIHNHNCAQNGFQFLSGTQNESSLPNQHSELPGLFHECSFLANFILIHQITANTDKGINAPDESKASYSSATVVSYIHDNHQRSLSLRAPPVLS